jgi:site-specific recombinase XerD
LKLIPEEQVWLAGLKTENTRRAYKLDIRHFAMTLGIRSQEQLYEVDHRAVILWEKYMREVEGLEPSTIRRRLSALSSLFRHLVKHGAVAQNPAREIKRPEIDRREGKTLAFSRKEARKILDAPSTDTIIGLRDRAILSVGFQVGFRRQEIAGLLVDSLHRNRGLDALWVKRKRKRNRQSVTVNPQTAQRIRDYREAAGHAVDLLGPLFRPVRNNGAQITRRLRRHMHPDGIDRVLRKYAQSVLGQSHGYSSHSMRTTFATTALENGADIEEVQYALGHADISTTKLYDRRGHNPEKAAAYFANY